MKNLVLKSDYVPILDVIETEVAIKFIKDNFENYLAKELNLIRVSAPLFVCSQSGLNDHLSGKERPVTFDVLDLKKDVEIVQSLAKWKRHALKKYQFNVDMGLYTDMNAIRRDEDLDNIHSIYVDQWDWEKVISKELRTFDYLKSVVNKIYNVLKKVEMIVCEKYPKLVGVLPNDIIFISTKELEAKYPNNTPKERESLICKEYGAVFIYQIGWPLNNGAPHDGRACDYDDWLLNGDILVWFETLNMGLELSSMGIRVTKESLVKQVEYLGQYSKLETPYAKDILNDNLPLTIGGGIGQSRICMFLLKKAHIGEVQASLWSDEDIELLEKCNIHLL